MVWGAISWPGASKLVLVKNTIKAARYVHVLKNTLVPFIEEKFSNDCRFQQDNAKESH